MGRCGQTSSQDKSFRTEETPREQEVVNATQFGSLNMSPRRGSGGGGAAALQLPVDSDISCDGNNLATSSSGLRFVDSNPVAILSHFECCVCYSICTPEIRQCQLGHLTCRQCLSHITSCPVCRTRMETTSRNLLAEKLLLLLNPSVPCSNTAFGCGVRLEISLLRDHEIVCPKRPSFYCPDLLCNGVLHLPEQLKTHFAKSHSYTMGTGRTMVGCLKMQAEVGGFSLGVDSAKATKVLRCYENGFDGRDFYIVTLVQRKTLFLWVYCAYIEGESDGESVGTARFEYSVHVKQKLLYKSAVVSLRRGAKCVIRSGKCLSLDEEEAKKIQNMGHIFYQVRINCNVKGQ